MAFLVGQVEAFKAFQAGNSGTYIQDAFQLLIPVLQVGAVWL